MQQIRQTAPQNTSLPFTQLPFNKKISYIFNLTIQLAYQAGERFIRFFKDLFVRQNMHEKNKLPLDQEQESEKTDLEQLETSTLTETTNLSTSVAEEVCQFTSHEPERTCSMQLPTDYLVDTVESLSVAEEACQLTETCPIMPQALQQTDIDQLKIDLDYGYFHAPALLEEFVISEHKIVLSSYDLNDFWYFPESDDPLKTQMRERFDKFIKNIEQLWVPCNSDEALSLFKINISSDSTAVRTGLNTFNLLTEKCGHLLSEITPEITREDMQIMKKLVDINLSPMPCENPSYDLITLRDMKICYNVFAKLMNYTIKSYQPLATHFISHLGALFNNIPNGHLEDDAIELLENDYNLMSLLMELDTNLSKYEPSDAEISFIRQFSTKPEESIFDLKIRTMSRGRTGGLTPIGVYKIAAFFSGRLHNISYEDIQFLINLSNSIYRFTEKNKHNSQEMQDLRTIQIAYDFALISKEEMEDIIRENREIDHSKMEKLRTFKIKFPEIVQRATRKFDLPLDSIFPLWFTDK